MSKISSRSSTLLVALVSGLGGAAICAGVTKLLSNKKGKKDPETDYSIAHDIVWTCIGGAMQSSMLYIGDRLKLYGILRECCAEEGSSVTAIELSERTGLNQRWLREWLAQQTAMGLLLLLPGEGDDDESLRYRIPKAAAEVLADETSKEYDIAMIQCVPSLVNRAKTMLPDAFRNGIGRPYDDPDVAEGINRHHKIHVRDVFLPEVIPAALNGRVLKMLQGGCVAADLGCGGGNILLAMAKAFPSSTFHGFDVSKAALEVASRQIASSKLRNVFLHDANEPSEQLGDKTHFYDLVTTFDVLHDAPNPAELVKQVKTALKPSGAWILGDIPGEASTRENLAKYPSPGMEWAFSACLCMSCSLSTEDGAGLGTLGFSIPVAKKLLKEGGFEDVTILLETANARWFLVQ